MNFAYEVCDGQLRFYIHGAKAGRKYSLLSTARCCSFELDIPRETVVSAEKKSITMHYESVMGKSSAVFLEDGEKQRALSLLAQRYTGIRDFKYSDEAEKKTAVIMLEVTEMTAKRNPSGK